MTQSQKRTRKSQAAPTRRLPLVLIAAGVVLLGAGLWSAVGARLFASKVPLEVTGAPRLKVDRLSDDLGDIKLGRTVEVSFQLANVGDQTLTFTEAPYIRIEEGCCAPTPTLGATVLRPGESTTLSMQFMMHADMGGPHDFRVKLATNDPAEPIELQVLSNWVP